jgi:hypothetical protein
MLLNMQKPIVLKVFSLLVLTLIFLWLPLFTSGYKISAAPAHKQYLSQASCPISRAENENTGGCVYYWLETAINFFSAIVGIVVVISIIIGGVQYSTAGSDPKKVAEAKGRIFNALIALLAFIFLYSFLQWLVPGGIFR